MNIRRNLIGAVVIAATALVGMAVPFGPSVSAATGEIVPNGGVETANPADATQPANWRHDSWGQTTASFSWPTSGAHGGTHSNRIDVSAYTDGGAKWSFDPQTVTPGAKYQYSSWYQSNKTTEILGVYTKTDGTTAYQWLANVAPAATWTQYTTAFTAPAGVAKLTIFHSITGVGFLQTDDFSITPFTPPPPPTSLGIVPNGDLEAANPLAPTLPANWQSGAWGTINATFSWPTGGAHSGTKATRIDVTSYTNGGAKWSFDPQPVTPLKSYQYSSWYKSNRTTEILGVYTLANGTTAYQLLANVPAAAAWTQYTTTFSTPANASKLTVFQSITGVGFVQTDDFSITAFTPKKLTRPLVSLSFDDGTGSHYTQVFPKLQSSGFLGTFYIISSYVDDACCPAQLTTPQVKAMSAAGMEIGGHTVTHPDLTTLTSAQQDAELQNSKTFLQGLTGKPVTSFASPYGAYNSALLTKIKALYATHRTVDDGFNQAGTTDFNKLKARQVLNTTTPAQVQAWVNQAKADGSWLILVFHDIYANPATYDTSPANFVADIDVVKNSGVTVKTVSDAAAEVAPQNTP
jgi:peptidoglycan/xylan/chitin deacetylase (PgdA/CDA1 family)